MPSDKDYKEIYGKSVFYPEFKAGIKTFGDFYIWAGYGFLSESGTTRVLEMEAKSKQHYISFGIGYIRNIIKEIGFKVEIGGFNVSYKEEAMDEEITDSAFGFRADGGIIFNLSKYVFIETSAGYLTASDTIEDKSIKLGGFKAGISIGLKF